MRISRIAVRRLPGIDDPFTLDALERDLVLVIGPNASGKSSLCRAIRSVLWPAEDAALKCVRPRH